MVKRLLVAPLNWGLGHASRCIPIIRSLQAAGVEPVLASDGVALDLLRAEFPDLESVALPAYGIRYDTPNMTWNVARRLPRVLWAIRAEHQAVARMVRHMGIEAVLSDNRYGCFHPDRPSVLITHQLRPRIPGRVASWTGHTMLRQALHRFDAVWVPDVAGEGNLSGELSHGTDIHPNTRYIGLLSRMRRYPRETEYDVAMVLSGPEPQRSRLEERLLEEALALPYRTAIVQGKTQSQQHYFAAEHVEVVSYLTSDTLNDLILAARAVVCRAGYSSIMDLAALGKKALLIPTPGQTEQEYLAEMLGDRGYFAWQTQAALDLEKGLRALEGTTGVPLSGLDGEEGYAGVLGEWLGIS
ncbi:MAG: glycosyltransferase [Saprospiraceae bacterium]|nr:glycosyltransferase [Saprospiraceae bacterium]